MEIVDMAWSLFSAVLGVVIGAWLAKRMLFSERNTLKMAEPIIEYVKMSFVAWIQTEQASKLLYQVGGVIAAGAKSGFGLQTTKTGKYKLTDMIEQIIGSFIQQKVLPKMGVQQTEQTASSEGGMDIK